MSVIAVMSSIVRRPPAFLGTAALLLSSVTAHGHDDVVPYGNLTKLLIGAHDDLNNTTSASQAAFGFDFGEDPNDPWVINDPGFNNSSAFTAGVFPGDGLLPASGSLVLSVFGGRYGPLHYWNGTGSPAFLPVSNGVEIALDSGTPFLRIGGTTTSGSISIGSITAGRIHKHIDSLIGAGGSGGSFTTQGAANGFYAFGATLAVPASGLLASDPIYFVYNVGMSETIHDEALDFYATHVVPEPSSLHACGLGLVCLAGGGAWRRLRKRPVDRAGRPLFLPPSPRVDSGDGESRS